MKNYPHIYNFNTLKLFTNLKNEILYILRGGSSLPPLLLGDALTRTLSPQKKTGGWQATPGALPGNFSQPRRNRLSAP